MEECSEQPLVLEDVTSFFVAHDLVSAEALLKTCYWFSRDFCCDVREGPPGRSLVWLKPRVPPTANPDEIRSVFLAQAMDFALRERVTKQTSEVRDVLLAKAFSESGVLEDRPEGIFGDSLEEEKADGMFKILSNS